MPEIIRPSVPIPETWKAHERAWIEEGSAKGRFELSVGILAARVFRDVLSSLLDPESEVPLPSRVIDIGAGDQPLSVEAVRAVMQARASGLAVPRPSLTLLDLRYINPEHRLRPLDWLSRIEEISPETRARYKVAFDAWNEFVQTAHPIRFKGEDKILMMKFSVLVENLEKALQDDIDLKMIRGRLADFNPASGQDFNLVLASIINYLPQDQVMRLVNNRHTRSILLVNADGVVTFNLYARKKNPSVNAPDTFASTAKCVAAIEQAGFRQVFNIDVYNSGAFPGTPIKNEHAFLFIKPRSPEEEAAIVDQFVRLKANGQLFAARYRNREGDPLQFSPSEGGLERVES